MSYDASKWAQERKLQGPAQAVINMLALWAHKDTRQVVYCPDALQDGGIPTIEQIAQAVGLDPRTVRDALAYLEQEEYIDRERRSRRHHPGKGRRMSDLITARTDVVGDPSQTYREFLRKRHPSRYKEEMRSGHLSVMPDQIPERWSAVMPAMSDQIPEHWDQGERVEKGDKRVDEPETRGSTTRAISNKEPIEIRTRRTDKDSGPTSPTSTSPRSQDLRAREARYPNIRIHSDPDVRIEESRLDGALEIDVYVDNVDVDFYPLRLWMDDLLCTALEHDMTVDALSSRLRLSWDTDNNWVQAMIGFEEVIVEQIGSVFEPSPQKRNAIARARLDGRTE